MSGLDAPMAWSNGPGETYAAHQHRYDKLLTVVAGSITFTTPEQSVLLRAGDRLELPAGTEHGAQVGADGVRCIEAHLPPGSVAIVRRVETASVAET